MVDIKAIRSFPLAPGGSILKVSSTSSEGNETKRCSDEHYHWDSREGGMSVNLFCSWGVHTLDTNKYVQRCRITMYCLAALYFACALRCKIG